MPEAIEIDTTEMTRDGQVAYCVDIVKKQMGL